MDEDNDMGKHSVMNGNTPPRARARAFTLIELMFAVAIMGVLALVGFPAYSDHLERSRVTQAITDILIMNSQLQRIKNDTALYPKLDPCGRPYLYLNIETGTDHSRPRKDRNLRPLNSDFDLYSMGKDGDSRAPLNARASRDDVLRANDGRWVNLASKYNL
jgi:general secretion pathway protein G